MARRRVSRTSRGRFVKTARKARGYMARRFSRRSKRPMTIPLGIVAGFIPAINDVRKNVPNYGVLGSIQHTSAGLIGWDTVSGKWVGWTQMKYAGTPGMLAGFAAHIIANKVGLNRALSRARIPLIRI